MINKALFGWSIFVFLFAYNLIVDVLVTDTSHESVSKVAKPRLLVVVQGVVLIF